MCLLSARPSPTRAMILNLCVLFYGAAFAAIARAQEALALPLVVAPSGEWYSFFRQNVAQGVVLTRA
jgi:hypothetical protein